MTYRATPHRIQPWLCQAHIDRANEPADKARLMTPNRTGPKTPGRDQVTIFDLLGA